MLEVLTRKVGAAAVSRLATVAAWVGTNVLLAWMLDKHQNGILQKSLIVVQMALFAGVLGTQECFRLILQRLDRISRRNFVVSLFLMAGFLAAGVAAGAPWFALLMSEPDLRALLWPGALVVLGVLPVAVIEPFLVAGNRAKIVAVMSIGAAVLQLTLVAAVLALHKPAQYVLYAIAAAGFLKLLLGVPVRKPLPVATSETELGLRLPRQFAYLLPIGLVSTTDMISNWLDRALVSVFYSSSDLATYTYGATQVPFLWMVIGLAAPVLLPQCFALPKDGNLVGVLDLWHRGIRRAAIVLLSSFFVFLWIAPEFLTMLYSGKYSDSAPYFRICLALLPVRIVAFMPMLLALGRSSYVIAGTVAEVVLNLAASLFLMQYTRLGMAGPAWGTVLGAVWQAWFFLRAIRESLGVTWSAVLPWRDLARDCYKCGSFFLLLAVPKLLHVPSVAMVAMSGLLYAIFVWYHVLPCLRASTPKSPLAGASWL